MMLALAAAFWLQLDSASSAATCVAILAQPKRGQAISKAVYRLLGTLIGAVVALVFMALFGQDRVLLLLSFTVWLGLCVFVAQFLQDTRAYGAMLSGYTVAIIALGQIDEPQGTFDAAVSRVAVIVLGIVVITFINDALASPSTWRALLPQLREAWDETRALRPRDAGGGRPRRHAHRRADPRYRADAGRCQRHRGRTGRRPVPRGRRAQLHRRALRDGGRDPQPRGRGGRPAQPEPGRRGGDGDLPAGGRRTGSRRPRPRRRAPARPDRRGHPRRDPPPRRGGGASARPRLRLRGDLRAGRHSCRRRRPPAAARRPAADPSRLPGRRARCPAGRPGASR